MATSKTFTYPFDPSGKLSSNKIERELHTLQFNGDRTFFIPEAAPFFKESVRVYNAQSGTNYEMGKDYILGHQFIQAGERTGRPIYGSVVFFNQSVGKLAAIDYQTVGGVWGVSDQGLTAELSNRLLNPLVRTWEQIEGLPEEFPPIDHDQNVGDFVGSDDIVDALKAMTDAIVSSAEGVNSKHLSDFDNPHHTTKDQVGLGNVQNYSVASDEAADQGTADNVYMTPSKTARTVQKLAVGVIDEHKDDIQNPHQVTKSQVGLGNVQNYGTASNDEAVGGVASNLHVTPAGMRAFFDKNNANSQVNDMKEVLTNHKQDHENPHGVTAAQVGAYTKTEVDNKFAAVKADDTAKFAGKSEQQWRESLPSNDDVKGIQTKIAEYFSAKSDDLNAIIITDGTISNQIVARNVVGGYNSYSVLTDANKVVMVGQSLLDEIHMKSTNFFQGRECAYLIDSDGLIYHAGSQGIQPPKEYRPGEAAPTNKPVKIVGNAGVAYALLADNRVLRWTASGYEILQDTGVVDIATSYGDTEHTGLLLSDGSIKLRGDSDFVAKVQPLLTTSAKTARLAVGDRYLFALGTNGKLTGWMYTTREDSDGNLATAASLVELDKDLKDRIFTDIAGVLNDFIFLTNDGLLRGYGSNSNGQLNFGNRTKKNIAVAAGNEFLLSVDQDYGVMVWGRVDRALNPPAFSG